MHRAVRLCECRSASGGQDRKLPSATARGKSVFFRGYVSKADDVVAVLGTPIVSQSSSVKSPGPGTGLQWVKRK